MNETSEQRALFELTRSLLAGTALPPQCAAELSAATLRRHHLAALAYRAGVAALQDDYRETAMRAAFQRELLSELAEAFARAKLRWGLIKGAAYVPALYPDPALRPMADVDVLVRAGDFDRGVSALRGLGFRVAQAPSRLRHALTLMRRPSELVDLHRSIMQPLRHRAGLLDLWTRANPDPAVPGLMRFAWGDHALLHIAHMTRHEFVVPLVSFIDVARLLALLDAEQERSLHAQLRTRGLGFSYEVLVGLLAELRAPLASRLPTRTLRQRLSWPRRDELGRAAHRSRGAQLVRKLLLCPADAPGLLLTRLAVAGEELRFTRASSR